MTRTENQAAISSTPTTPVAEVGFLSYGVRYRSTLLRPPVPADAASKTVGARPGTAKWYTIAVRDNRAAIITREAQRDNPTIGLATGTYGACIV